jgi:phosphoribosyl-AMP cyclohydrolase
MNETLEIDFEKEGGIIPVVAQDIDTGEVLMLAWMNSEAWQETLRTGRVCYYSRSRQKLWRKGEESGNHQDVREIYVDCDRDVVLLKIHQHGGAACHEGFRSCFYRRREGDGWRIIAERVFDPVQVYKQRPSGSGPKRP